MGDSKKKALAINVESELTDEMRMEMLGNNPFESACDFLSNMVGQFLSEHGRPCQGLMGLDFESGVPQGISMARLKNVEDIPIQRARLLMEWPMAVHIFQAWEAPDNSFPAHEHPDRLEVVTFMLMTKDIVGYASCRINYEQRTLGNPELCFPNSVSGELGMEPPTRH